MCGPMTSVPSAAQVVEWRLPVDVEMGTIEPERLVPARDFASERPTASDACKGVIRRFIGVGPCSSLAVPR